MQLAQYDTEQRYVAKVLSSIRITSEKSQEDVREIVMEVDSQIFDVRIGQTIGVIVPGPHFFGNDFHFRLYTIADLPKRKQGNKTDIAICVKRCNYIDEYSGEQFKGVASNYLCDLKENDNCELCGPYGYPFEIPDNKTSDLLLIGMGTGIAPFRAMVKYIYEKLGGWQGKVRLFHGAQTGLELLYMNDKLNDFENYYDQQTFAAFEALSLRPHWAEPSALNQALVARTTEIWEMINKPDTYVYVVGLESIREMLISAFSKMAGSDEKWRRKKAELTAGRRWIELIY